MKPEKKTTSWFSVSVTADALAETAVDTAFGILDSSGTQIDLLSKRSGEETLVVGYFEAEPVKSEVEKAISESLTNFGFEREVVKNIEYDDVPEKDWLEEWKKHWKPTIVGSFLVTPPWQEIAVVGDKILISIEPSMAFGTGTHETTRLCLELIEKYYKKPMSFLDVGTGTGILSIACAKLASDLAATKILAVDVDEDSIKIARENAVSNGVPDIGFENGSISPLTPKFDFVCANLTIDVISPMLPLLLEKTEQVLILSGILIEQEDALRTDLRALGCETPDVIREGEWIAAVILRDGIRS